MKRSILLILAIVTVLTFAGCGIQDLKDDKSTNVKSEALKEGNCEKCFQPLQSNHIVETLTWSVFRRCEIYSSCQDMRISIANQPM